MNLLSDPTKRRWLGWGSLAFVFFLVNIHRLSTAVLSEELTTGFAITASELGTLHAAFFVVYAIVQIPTGVLVDRYGPRYIGASGAFVLSLGAIGFTASDGYVFAVLSRVLLGLGSGVIFVSILRFCANWYRYNEFATMTGMTTGVAGLGAIFATTPLAIAVDWFGWRSTLFTFALLGFVAGGSVFVFARRSPSDAGLEPIDDVPKQPSVSLAETRDHLRKLLSDVDQWLLSLTFFAANGTILTIIGLWGVPYLVVVYGFEITTASYYTFIASVGMLVGAPAVGWLSDRIERRFLPMIVGFGVYVLALSTIPVFGTLPSFALPAVYFTIGFSLGATTLVLTVVKDSYPAGASGVAIATVNAAGFLGATVLPMAMGYSLDRYRTGDQVAGTVAYTEFGYRIAFGITTVVVITALLSALLLARRSE